jgi:hypothetical protein
MAQGLRQFAARPSWRPGARIFTGRGLRDAFGQRPCLTWAVTARGSAYGNRLPAYGRRGERWFWSREAALSATGPQRCVTRPAFVDTLDAESRRALWDAALTPDPSICATGA